jgi:hypothetical protein
VASAGDRNAIPKGMAFCAFTGFFFPIVDLAQSFNISIEARLTCQQGLFAVVSDLPDNRLTLAPEDGQCKLAEQGNIANQFNPYWQQAADAP